MNEKKKRVIYLEGRVQKEMDKKKLVPLGKRGCEGTKINLNLVNVKKRSKYLYFDIILVHKNMVNNIGKKN